jgi:hypothetical protein
MRRHRQHRVGAGDPLAHLAFTGGHQLGRRAQLNAVARVAGQVAVGGFDRARRGALGDHGEHGGGVTVGAGKQGREQKHQRSTGAGERSSVHVSVDLSAARHQRA